MKVNNIVNETPEPNSRTSVRLKLCGWKENWVTRQYSLLYVLIAFFLLEISLCWFWEIKDEPFPWFIFIIEPRNSQKQHVFKYQILTNYLPTTTMKVICINFSKLDWPHSYKAFCNKSVDRTKHQFANKIPPKHVHNDNSFYPENKFSFRTSK